MLYVLFREDRLHTVRSVRDLINGQGKMINLKPIVFSENNLILVTTAELKPPGGSALHVSLTLVRVVHTLSCDQGAMTTLLQDHAGFFLDFHVLNSMLITCVPCLSLFASRVTHEKLGSKIKFYVISLCVLVVKYPCLNNFFIVKVS